MISTEYKKVETTNGHQLLSTFYLPEGEATGAVLIVPAMGVSQKYYRPFCSWLASQGYMVATFDYSGTGQSLVGSMRDTDVTITEWASCDCTAMLEAVTKRADGLDYQGYQHRKRQWVLVGEHAFVKMACVVALVLRSSTGDEDIWVFSRKKAP